jgi:hypothetical protein
MDIPKVKTTYRHLRMLGSAMSGNAGDQQARGKRAEAIASGYLQGKGCHILARHAHGTRANPIYDFDVECPSEGGWETRRIEVKEAKIEVVEPRDGRAYTRSGRFVMKRNEPRDCYAFVVDNFYDDSVTLDFVQADVVDPMYSRRGKSPKFNINRVAEVRRHKCFDWLDEAIQIPHTSLEGQR